MGAWWPDEKSPLFPLFPLLLFPLDLLVLLLSFLLLFIVNPSSIIQHHSILRLSIDVCMLHTARTTIINHNHHAAPFFPILLAYHYPHTPFSHSPPQPRHPLGHRSTAAVMSQLPWTPNKGSLKKPTASPQSTGRANDKSMSSSKSKLASLNEPSPASTYGDTARSSMPATPLETDTRGKLQVSFSFIAVPLLSFSLARWIFILHFQVSSMFQRCNSAYIFSPFIWEIPASCTQTALYNAFHAFEPLNSTQVDCY